MATSGFSGLSEFRASLVRKTEAVDIAVGRAVGESAFELEARAKAEFSQSHAAGTPSPSPAGSPPAVVTGTLRRSIRSEGPKRLGFGIYEAQVGPTAIYARVQELGGGPSRLPARPFFAPAFEKFDAEGILGRRVRAGVIEALRV